jgi:hypothetical protein
MAKNRKKYIRLAHGEAMWKHQTANLSLQAFTTQNIENGDNYLEVSKISENLLSSIDDAVKKGSLDYVSKHDEEYVVRPTNSPIVPPVTTTRGRFKWTDTGEGTKGKVLKTPSFSYRSIGFDNDSEIYKKAFTILSGTPSNAVKDIEAVLVKLDNKMDKLEFVEACYSIEKEGKNPSMHPRDVVMMCVSDILNDLGKSTGISSVSVDTEPPVKDVKPLRFVT